MAAMMACAGSTSWSGKAAQDHMMRFSFGAHFGSRAGFPRGHSHSLSGKDQLIAYRCTATLLEARQETATCAEDARAVSACAPVQHCAAREVAAQAHQPGPAKQLLLIPCRPVMARQHRCQPVKGSSTMNSMHETLIRVSEDSLLRAHTPDQG